MESRRAEGPPSGYPQPSAPPAQQKYPAINTVEAFDTQRPPSQGSPQGPAYPPQRGYEQQGPPQQSERGIYMDRPMQYEQQTTTYVDRPGYGQPMYNAPPQVVQQETVYTSGPQPRYQQGYGYGPPPQYGPPPPGYGPGYGPAPYGYGPPPYAQQQPVIVNETNVYENGPGYGGGYGGGGGFTNMEAGLLGAGGGFLGGLVIGDLIN